MNTRRARHRRATLAVIEREHWDIENKLHWVRDVTFSEDHSQVRTERIPQVMAALRNQRCPESKDSSASCGWDWTSIKAR